MVKKRKDELLADRLLAFAVSVIKIVNDLPQMFEKDPVAIAIGAKEGDIVKIIRESKTTVKSVNYYRYVKKEKV